MRRPPPLVRRALRRLVGLGLAAVALAAAPGCGPDAPRADRLRLGHFPNLTHAPALVARSFEREGTRWLGDRLGVTVEWHAVNAGPAAMEALLSGALDATFVGPNPALNAHLRSRGEEVRVLCGTTLGGSGLAARKGTGLRAPADFRGRTIATPQLGNTQDVACRAWLRGGGLRVTPTGGDATVLPAANPDQLDLLLTGKVDGVWTVEPWLARLEVDAGAEVVLLEPDALTTVLVGSRRLVDERRPLARRLVAATEELTAFLAAKPDEAKARVRAELKALTTRELPVAVLDRAWPRLRFSTAISVAPFAAVVTAAREAGLLGVDGPLDRLVAPP